MYRKILVPVDLEHADRLEKALKTAADLSNHYEIPLCYVGVSASLPGAVAHTPAEFKQKLEAFGRQESEKHGVEAATLAYTSHDPSVDLDETLLKAIDDSGADLVVMASHLPGLPEHIFASNAGYLASHASVSVFVVR
jgi:nucleotide-binding universal stress UspA family protein